MTQVRVAGVGMVPFAKPSAGKHYEELAPAAIEAALADAGLDLADVRQVFASYVYGDSTCGQAALYRLGMPGVPLVNVSNNCSSGSSALWLARQAIVSREVDVALAFGFEEMRPGALVDHWTDRLSPVASFMARHDELYGVAPAGTPGAAQVFGAAGRAHQERFGTSAEAFALISVKARRHAAANPYAVFREEITLDEVLASPQIYGPLTRLQCCPPTSGAAAVVLVSEEYAKRHGTAAKVRIAGQMLATDTETTFTGDARQLVGYDIAVRAAEGAYAQAGIGPEDVPVVELHDCFTANELIAYEALGLTPEGTAEKFIVDGQNTHGGRVVTNPSGGLLSKGHPLGATGLAQCAELTWQLRGQAGDRQVEGAKVALQHNVGLGSACVVTVYESVN
ncbi:thiolase C-terminal domain-containing protein [Amycolatopsis pigmentata]|uniref:propanoyl-CoA C-acyltransferase n=1 Tax=Amycolatopsis pigmentata TaxID=450801 RepID=A0ABW5G4Q0_9PSEU